MACDNSLLQCKQSKNKTNVLCAEC